MIVFEKVWRSLKKAENHIKRVLIVLVIKRKENQKIIAKMKQLKKEIDREKYKKVAMGLKRLVLEDQTRNSVMPYNIQNQILEMIMRTIYTRFLKYTSTVIT